MKTDAAKTAIITGASGGIGRAVAVRLSREGYFTVLCGRNRAKLKETASLTTNKSAVIRSDISTYKGINTLISSYPKAEILVNNAGFSEYCGFLNQKTSNIRKIIMVNAEAPAVLASHYLKHMVSWNRGYILNIASTAGTFPTPYMSVYGAAKAFLISFSAAVALELKETGVKISCLLPGPVNTGFWESAGAADKVQKSVKHFDTADIVAAEAIKAMKKGSIREISGVNNKIKNIIKCMLPESVALEMIRRHMLKK